MNFNEPLMKEYHCAVDMPVTRSYGGDDFLVGRGEIDSKLLCFGSMSPRRGVRKDDRRRAVVSSWMVAMSGRSALAFHLPMLTLLAYWLSI